jgi:hypothetical protein
MRSPTVVAVLDSDLVEIGGVSAQTLTETTLSLEDFAEISL